MKVLVTGAKGQLGYDVIKRLEIEDVDHLGIDLAECDITDKDQVDRTLSDYSPDVVIHCAAYTAVDKAEDERDICYKINVIGTQNVADACQSINA